jgi:hypothetical protein
VLRRKKLYICWKIVLHLCNCASAGRRKFNVSKFWAAIRNIQGICQWHLGKGAGKKSPVCKGDVVLRQKQCLARTPFLRQCHTEPKRALSEPVQQRQCHVHTSLRPQEPHVRPTCHRQLVSPTVNSALRWVGRVVCRHGRLERVYRRYRPERVDCLQHLERFDRLYYPQQEILTFEPPDTAEPCWIRRIRAG